MSVNHRVGPYVFSDEARSSFAKLRDGIALHNGQLRRLAERGFIVEIAGEWRPHPSVLLEFNRAYGQVVKDNGQSGAQPMSKTAGKKKYFNCGHSITKANTYLVGTYRRCLACKRENARAYDKARNAMRKGGHAYPFPPCLIQEIWR